jgi:acyl-CoA dehydrogenase
MPNPNDARLAFQHYTDALRANAYVADAHLQAIITRHAPDVADTAQVFGAVVSGELDALVRVSNQDEHLPRLARWDGQGNRTEGIAFHPSYHAVGRLAYATGAMGRYARPGHELGTLALTYLLAQDGEGGHACPFACTAGLIKILQLAAPGSPHRARFEGWLERLYDANYDTHFHGAQFLTEVQGGSDVGANALVAREAADGWTLHGEKWFCSVADAQLFLVTARPEGAADGTRGVRAFVVPRSLDDGQTNSFQLRRLKYKLGTRSMASSEIDFLGARAYPVGDFKDVLEVVLNTSRLYNAVCSSGMMQRALREARHYAHHRLAFGAPIVQFPAIAQIVARLHTEAAAARASTFLLAALADRLATAENARDHQALRMLVNLNKYWTAHAGTTVVRDAIEVLGGNGAIEEFTVLPRLLRDSIVCEAWEGGHNLLCAQVLRDSQRLRLHEPMFGWLRDTFGQDPALDAVEARWRRLLELPEARAAGAVRSVADALRPVVQALALRADGRTVEADHLRALHDPARDPLEDTSFDDRARQLASRPA